MNDIALKLSLPKGPDHYWRIMRERTAAGGFTITDIYKSSNGVTREAVKLYILGCERENYVQRIGAKEDRSAIFRVVSDFIAAPQIPKTGEGRHGQIRQNIWTAMRVIGAFDLRSLALTASTDEVEVSLKTATRFVCQLRQAGLVELLDDGGKNKPSTFRLKSAANSGPRAPRIFDARIVFDANSQKVVGQAVANEVQS